MAKFLSQDELYRVLQRELPRDVYADGAPSAYFSTADNYSVARVLATAYDNLERVYENYFPQTTDEKIGDWEVTVFGAVSDATLTLQERRDRVIKKIRNKPGITKADVLSAVTGAFPQLAPTGVELLEWGCCDGGGWTLDLSELDFDTYLNGMSRLRAVGPDLCDADPATFGLTAAQWAEMQSDAYTYEVVISDHTFTDAQLTALDLLLTAVEPARSTHVISTTSYLTTEDGDILVTEDGDPLVV